MTPTPNARIAQAAYEAYRAANNTNSDDTPLPEFAALPELHQQRWLNAALAAHKHAETERSEKREKVLTDHVKKLRKNLIYDLAQCLSRAAQITDAPETAAVLSRMLASDVDNAAALAARLRDTIAPPADERRAEYLAKAEQHFQKAKPTRPQPARSRRRPPSPEKPPPPATS